MWAARLSAQLSATRAGPSLPLPTLSSAANSPKTKLALAGRDGHPPYKAGIVIGLPLNMDGSESPRSQSSRAFARNIADLGLPILLWDERWSTQAVERDMIAADMSRAKRAERIDNAAAAAYYPSGGDRRIDCVKLAQATAFPLRALRFNDMVTEYRRRPLSSWFGTLFRTGICWALPDFKNGKYSTF
jgi:RNase H-fold protein (predicted Holliday junction resolvase)